MDKKIEELLQKRETVKLGGGKKRIERQHSSGKLTARERIDQLLDPGSFIELDRFVHGEGEEFYGEGVVTGYGTINGRLVYLFAQDFTVYGGALGVLHSRKICKAMDLAIKTGSPFIGLNDSGGARIHEGVYSLDAYGDIFFRNTQASGVIPQISVIMGPCAGGAVYSPAITDFIVMVNQTSQMFITGPQVIKTVTGEEVSAEVLGGAKAQNQKSGVAHFMAANEEDTFALIRNLLKFLPQNNMEQAPRIEPREPVTPQEELLTLVPADTNKWYDVRKVIKALVDGGDFLEVQPLFAQNAVVGFARLDGVSVGIVANQARVLAGCLNIDASDKISRFVRFCDSFNIPLITFVDVPGFLPGVAQEHGGIIRHGAKILYAYSEATVPKISLILRKAYGGAYVAMCSRSLGADAAYAWPIAEIAVMGPDGAANIIYKDEINSAEDPEEVKKRKVIEYREKYANPYIACEKGMIDDVIDPKDTRRVLINTLHSLATKKVTRAPRKHGNIPF